MALEKIASLSEPCFRFDFQVGDVRRLSNSEGFAHFLIPAHSGALELRFSDPTHVDIEASFLVTPS